MQFGSLSCGLCKRDVMDPAIEAFYVVDQDLPFAPLEWPCYCGECYDLIIKKREVWGLPQPQYVVFCDEG